MTAMINKCFWYGHDWVIIKKMYTTECALPRMIRVCLRCDRIHDTITAYKEFLEQEKNKKMSRKERAQEIYDTRHKRC